MQKQSHIDSLSSSLERNQDQLKKINDIFAEQCFQDYLRANNIDIRQVKFTFGRTQCEKMEDKLRSDANSQAQATAHQLTRQMTSLNKRLKEIAHKRLRLQNEQTQHITDLIQESRSAHQVLESQNQNILSYLQGLLETESRIKAKIKQYLEQQLGTNKQLELFLRQNLYAYCRIDQEQFLKILLSNTSNPGLKLNALSSRELLLQQKCALKREIVALQKQFDDEIAQQEQELISNEVQSTKKIQQFSKILGAFDSWVQAAKPHKRVKSQNESFQPFSRPGGFFPDGAQQLDKENFCPGQSQLEASKQNVALNQSSDSFKLRDITSASNNNNNTATSGQLAEPSHKDG